MVYIDRDGRVLERRPWNVARIKELLASIWFVCVQFFMTLMAPFMNTNYNSRGNNARRSGWGSGGGGGSGGSNGRNNFGPNRRIGRVQNTSMDCNIPGGGG